MFSKQSIIYNLTSAKGSSITVATLLFIMMLMVISKYLQVNIWSLSSTLGKKMMGYIASAINKREKLYHREIEIGKINEKNRKVKTYRFLNDLIIDLGLRRRGANPYELLFLITVGSFLLSMIGCQLLFRSVVMGLVMFPMVMAGLVCALYTKANIAHDTRIEAIIESENTISSNIKDGVVVAVRNSLDMLPREVRTEYQDFLDNIEHKNYHIRDALLELHNNLGPTAEEFIKKCIVFEMEEEHGIADMFNDIIEINNIKSARRTDMKRKFEEVSTEFTIGASMIFTFLGGVIVIFEPIANFYFNTALGQLILAADVLILIGEFVFITYLRAKEL